MIFNADSSAKNRGGYRPFERLFVAELSDDRPQWDLRPKGARGADKDIVAKKVRHAQVKTAGTSIGLFGQGARRVHNEHDGAGGVRKIETGAAAHSPAPREVPADPADLSALNFASVRLNASSRATNPDGARHARSTGKRTESLTPNSQLRTWHRMGDCGYLDAEGRLWFSGRKVERVQTTTGSMFTEPCEQVFRAHPQVARCALIGLGPMGHQIPALVAEKAVSSADEAKKLAKELRHLARAEVHTSSIRQFYFIDNLPVDVRHNAKIHRLQLAKWAITAKSYQGS